MTIFLGLCGGGETLILETFIKKNIFIHTVCMYIAAKQLEIQNSGTHTHNTRANNSFLNNKAKI